MCILFLYINPHAQKDQYRLILASNRDEHYHRPAKAASRWCDDNDIIAGQDMELGREGGTWLGASLKPSENVQFKIGALLNVTGEPKISGGKGRGFIVTNYLKGTSKTEEYVNTFISNDHLYNAFSFVTVELGKHTDSMKAFHYTNVRPENKLTEFKCDSPVLLGFGNSLLSEPFQKVEAGKDEFKKIIESLNSREHKDKLISELVNLLKWEKRHLPDEVLDRRAPDIKELLSSIFVKVLEAGYGSRTHTVILVDHEGEVDYFEETMKSQTSWEKSHLVAHL